MSEVEEIRLYSNGSTEDRRAFDLLQDSGIPFAKFGPTSEEKTPYLEYGFWKYSGVSEIEVFIAGWKKHELPDPYPSRAKHPPVSMQP